MSDKWVYGFLAELGNEYRMIFAVFQILILIFAYKLGEKINIFLWRPNQMVKSKSKKIM